MPQKSYQEILAEARQQQPRRSLWDRINTPLTDFFGRKTRELANSEFFDPEEDDTWLTTRAKGFAQGALGGAGDVADSFTSPLSLTLTASGLSGLSNSVRAVRAARGIQRTAAVAGGAHGASRMAEGVQEGDMGEFGAGALESALSLTGLHKRTLPTTRAERAASATASAPKTNIPDARFIPRQLRERANSLGMTDEQMKTMSAEQVMKGVRSLEYAKRKLNPQADLPMPPEKNYVTMTTQRLRELQKAGDRQAATELRTRRKMKAPEDFDTPAAVTMPRGKDVDFGAPINTAEPGAPNRGNPFHRKTGNRGFDDAYKDWVNARRASNSEGIVRRREFSDLDAEGLDGILKYNDGVRTGRFADVQAYYDDMHKELGKRLGKFGFKENYLPQLWEESADQVQTAFRRLGLKPSFTLPSLVENYRTGIAMGLTPKFKTISELTGWYEKTAKKTIADVDFFSMLKDKGWIRPEGRGVGKDWVTLNPDHFPIYLSDYGRQNYKAPKPVARAINNYLAPGTDWVNWVADKASITKNVVLSAGIPKTALNAHGFNIAARAFMGGGLKDAGRALKYMVNPKAGGKWVDEHLAELPDAVRHGLVITTEDHLFGSTGSVHLLRTPRTKVGKVANKGFNKLLETHGKLFEDPLFQNMIPALKMQHYRQISNQLLKSGLDEKAAKRQAAQSTNALYGGINWEEMMRSRDLQNTMRSLMIAPDWFESQYRIGKGMANSLRDPKNPAGQQYKTVARNLIAGYVGANVVNYAINGHFMWDNPTGHAFDIKMGKAGGKDRYLRPFGTAADFFRLPVDTLAAMASEGDLSAPQRVFKNRRSTLFKFGSNLISNQDDFGRPILGKDNFGRMQSLPGQALNFGSEVADITTPAYFSGTLDHLRGRSKSLEESIMGSIEFPFRYANPPGTQRTRRRRRRRER